MNKKFKALFDEMRGKTLSALCYNEEKDYYTIIFDNGGGFDFRFAEMTQGEWAMMIRQDSNGMLYCRVQAVEGE